MCAWASQLSLLATAGVRVKDWKENKRARNSSVNCRRFSTRYCVSDGTWKSVEGLEDTVRGDAISRIRIETEIATFVCTIIHIAILLDSYCSTGRYKL
jgi:hypothetical protein